MFLIIGLSVGPCRSQPSRCMSTMTRPVCSGERSNELTAFIKTLRAHFLFSFFANGLIQISVVEVLCRRLRAADDLQKRRDIRRREFDLEIVGIIIQRFSLDRKVSAHAL